MKNLRIFSIFIATILLGASAIVYAGDIDSGSIDVVVNDDVYGTVSPTLNLDNTSITLNAIKTEKNGKISYKVKDNITIPLNVVLDKEKIYLNKMITGRVKLYGSLSDIRAKEWFNAYVADGELIDKEVEVPESVSVPVNYQISNETFNEGEELVMCTLVMGRHLPGKADDSSFLFSLDNLIEDSFLFGLGKIIKEFIDIDTTFNLRLQVLTIKHIKLDVTYEFGGSQPPPEDEYILNATVAEGKGKITKKPNLDSYPNGTNVTLKAVASPGYYFEKWEGDIDGSENPTYIIMDENKSVQAFFLETPVKITPESFGIRKASFKVKNQEETNISFSWNITLEGGLLGRVNTFSSGMVENLSANKSATINSGKTKLFAFGPGEITLNIAIPSEEIITEKYGITILGPIVLVN